MHPNYAWLKFLVDWIEEEVVKTTWEKTGPFVFCKSLNYKFHLFHQAIDDFKGP